MKVQKIHLTVRCIWRIRQKGGKCLVKEMPGVTTEEKLGKVTYIIQFSASPEAKDTIAKKIKKSIKRDVEKLEEKSKVI